MTRTVLLFAHGGGFNKRGWDPILRDLKNSNLLRRLSCDYVTHDFRYHGENYDHSKPSKIEYDNGYPCRVQHPAGEWTEWAPRDLLDIAKRIKNPETRIIGIGHSMGASSLLKIETILAPGLFDGLILFEPIINIMTDDASTSQQKAMINATLKRPFEWDTWEEVTSWFESDRFFRRWNKEALEEHVQGAVYEVSDHSSTSNQKRFQLACPPFQEASLYDHKAIEITATDLARTQCPMFFHYGDKSKMRPLIHISTIPAPLPATVVCDDMADASHTMVFEWPKECAERIINDLNTISFVKERLNNSAL